MWYRVGRLTCWPFKRRHGDDQYSKHTATYLIWVNIRVGGLGIYIQQLGVSIFGQYFNMLGKIFNVRYIWGMSCYNFLKKLYQVILFLSFFLGFCPFLFHCHHAMTWILYWPRLYQNQKWKYALWHLYSTMKLILWRKIQKWGSTKNINFYRVITFLEAFCL